jgi:hypothetical protein
MQNIHRSGFDERRALFRELIDEGDNAAWEFLDRSATRDALDRFRELTNVQRRELYGALTALLWCTRQRERVRPSAIRARLDGSHGPAGR